MKITERENLLLRRALDKATTANEAEIAAKALIASLRERGVSGYDFVPPNGQTRSSTSPPTPQSTQTDQTGWREEFRRAQEDTWKQAAAEQAKTNAAGAEYARNAAEFWRQWDQAKQNEWEAWRAANWRDEPPKQLSWSQTCGVLGAGGCIVIGLFTLTSGPGLLFIGIAAILIYKICKRR